MRNIESSEITKNIKEMCIEANHFLAPDMERVFKKAKENEESKLGCQILEQLDENLKIAAEDMIPICQDTGMAVVFIEIGQGRTYRRRKLRRCNKRRCSSGIC